MLNDTLSLSLLLNQSIKEIHLCLTRCRTDWGVKRYSVSQTSTQSISKGDTLLSHDQRLFALIFGGWELCGYSTVGSDGSGFLGCIRVSPAAFGNPRRAIASRDAHIWGSIFQKEDNAPSTLPAGSVTYSSHLRWLFGRHGMDGAMEGHNISRTSPRRTSKSLIFRDPCVFAGDLKNAYARAWVLSTHQAVVVGRLSRDFNHLFLEFTCIIWHKWHGWSIGRT